MDKDLKTRSIDLFFKIRNIDASISSKIQVSEFLIMKCIAGNSAGSNKNVRPSDIQKRLYISKASISQKLGSLEDKGYITRDRDENNRRNLTVLLTPGGYGALETLEKQIDRFLAALACRLGEDELKKMLKNIHCFIDIVFEINEEARWI